MNFGRIVMTRLSGLGLALVATAVHASPLFLAGPRSDGVALPRPAQPDEQSAMQKPEAAVPVEALPLPRIVNQAAFCGRLRQAFSQYAASNGYDSLQQALLATSATAGIIEEFKLGRAADYLSSAALAAYSRVPQRGATGGYLPLAGFVGSALGVGDDVALALSAGELRFISHAQKNKGIVVIAHNAASLTPERVQMIADLARRAKISINVVWVGDSPEEGQANADVRSLAWLASATGGALVNLSGRGNPCAEST